MKRGRARESKRGRERLKFREGDGEAIAIKETNCEQHKTKRENDRQQHNSYKKDLFSLLATFSIQIGFVSILLSQLLI